MQSFQELADAVGVSKAHIWQIERGKATNPAINVVTKIADHYGVSVAWLVGEDLADSDADPELQGMFRQAQILDEHERKILSDMMASLLKSRASRTDGSTAVEVRRDRMEIELAGPDVVDMARAFHRQLGSLHGPIDVEGIAYELDDCEIRDEPLDNVEGALLTTPDKTAGSILVNRRPGLRRRRFTIAHELCHLLHTHNRPLGQQGFPCASKDIRIRSHLPKPGMTRDERQEWQANRFAIEVLVPEYLLTRYLEDQPCMEFVLEMADELDVSREAAARRFIEKCEAPLAMVFTQHGRVRYAVKNDGFPLLGVEPGGPVVIVGDEVG
ncbi:MAG: XRE family transcriptional regulator [Pseudomonadota bacterium]